MGDALMVLPVTYWVHGYCYDTDGSALAGVTVTIQDVTDNQGTVSTTTNASGYYQLNIQNISTNGDLIRVTFDNGVTECDELFTLDLDNLTTEVSHSYSDETFNLTTDTYSICFPKPSWNSANGAVDKEVEVFNFELSNDNLEVIDRGIGSEPLRLKGHIARGNSDDVISGKFEAIWNIQNDGEEVTITGLGDCINAVYILKSFKVRTIKKSKTYYTWSMDFELVRTT